MAAIVHSMGRGTYDVPTSLHAELRARLVARARAGGWAVGGVALLEGGHQQTRYSSDTDVLFRQESFFQYLFGVREPGCYGAVDLETGRALLFVPRLPDAYAVWSGRIHPPAHFAAAYGVDAAYYTDELATVLAGVHPGGAGAVVLHLLRGVNTDSGLVHPPADFPGRDGFATNLTLLHPALSECRVTKTDAELALLRYVNRVSSRAHVQVMRACRVGGREYDLEAVFLYEAYRHGGCRHASYTCICGAGEHGATLHYGHAGAPNDGAVRAGDMCLMDMGAEYHCYASDITCSFPATGRFTPEQRAIYTTVLAAQRAVFAAMRPGVSWPDMHRLAGP
jgi:Xaa-Pro dipeptidase